MDERTPEGREAPERKNRVSPWSWSQLSRHARIVALGVASITLVMTVLQYLYLQSRSTATRDDIALIQMRELQAEISNLRSQSERLRAASLSI